LQYFTAYDTDWDPDYRLDYPELESGQIRQTGSEVHAASYLTGALSLG